MQVNPFSTTMRVSPDIKIYFNNTNPLARHVKPLDKSSCANKYFLYRIWNAIKAVFNRSDWQIAKKKLLNQVKNLLSTANYLPQQEREKSAKLWTQFILYLAIDKNCTNPTQTVNKLDDELEGDIMDLPNHQRKKYASIWSKSIIRGSTLSKPTLDAYRQALKHHLFHNTRRPISVDTWRIFPIGTLDSDVEESIRTTNSKIIDVIHRATQDEFFSRDPFAYMLMWARNLNSLHSDVWGQNRDIARRAYEWLTQHLGSLTT